MIEQLSLLPHYLTAHLQLTLLALLLSIIGSIPVGIAATRIKWLERPTLAVASVIQTIPSLAFLALMVPILSFLELRSIGFLPAIIGLTLYGVLPVLRNTVTGIAGVPPEFKEAARGVGMTPHQQLTLVELPLAMPVIIAGIRTATIWLVGITTLSTPVGATSLGNYIFSGLQTRNYSAIIIGCIAAAALALLLDGLVRAIEAGLVKRKRRSLVTSLSIFAVLYGYVFVTLLSPLFGEQTRPVVIGSKTFTEQYILSNTLARWIEQETVHQTELVQSLGSMVAFDALNAGDIDIYVDYSGTLWANAMHRSDSNSSRVEVLNAVTRFLHNEHGITIGATLGFENAYALAVRRTDALQNDLLSISDLRPFAPSLSIGGDYEFFARPEWIAIRDTYGLEFRELRTMDPALMYQATNEREVDVIGAFSTDGRISSYDLQVLKDDLNTIPPYDAVVLLSARLAYDAPEVLSAIARLDGMISAETMRRMNRLVDEDGAAPATVAVSLIEQLSVELSLQ